MQLALLNPAAPLHAEASEDLAGVQRLFQHALLTYPRFAAKNFKAQGLSPDGPRQLDVRMASLAAVCKARCAGVRTALGRLEKILDSSGGGSLGSADSRLCAGISATSILLFIHFVRVDSRTTALRRRQPFKGTAVKSVIRCLRSFQLLFSVVIADFDKFSVRAALEPLRASERAPPEQPPMSIFSQLHLVYLALHGGSVFVQAIAAVASCMGTQGLRAAEACRGSLVAAPRSPSDKKDLAVHVDAGKAKKKRSATPFDPHK